MMLELTVKECICVPRGLTDSEPARAGMGVSGRASYPLGGLLSVHSQLSRSCSRSV